MSFQEEQNREQTMEVAGEFGESIRDFRAALNHVAERETATPMMTANWLAPARLRQRRHHQHVALAWACAAVLCAATTLPFMVHPHPGVAVHPAVQAITTTTATVEAPQSGLLEQVDEDVSESAPSSLAPLTEMDSWNTTNASSENSTQPTENTNAAH